MNQNENIRCKVHNGNLFVIILSKSKVTWAETKPKLPTVSDSQDLQLDEAVVCTGTPAERQEGGNASSVAALDHLH